MNRKKRLEELTQKNPTHKKFIESTKMLHKQAMKITNAIKNSPMVELMEMQHLMNAKPDKFNPEGDFSIINFHGEEIGLSPMQALAVEHMYNEQKKGKKSVFVQDILDACNTKETSLHGLFKRKNVMGNFILRKRNTYYYLDI